MDALTHEMAALNLPLSTVKNFDTVIYDGVQGSDECVVVLHCKVDFSPTPRRTPSEYAGHSLLIRERCDQANGCMAELMKLK